MLAEELDVASLFGALFTPAVWADPYPLYAELLERGAVTHLGGFHWVVAGHAEVRSVLHHRGCSSDERRGSANRSEPVDSYPQIMRELFLFADPPDHTRLRKLVVRAFTPMQVRSVEPRAEAIVGRLLDDAAQRTHFDIVDDLARPLAVEIICELLGVPFADRERFGDWGDALARLLDPGALRTPQQDLVGRDAAHAFCDYFARLIALRRASPGEDLLSELIAAEADGDRLKSSELIAVCLLLLVAGFETTMNLIGNGVVALLDDRRAYASLGQAPCMAATTVNELLRIDSPVQMTVRIAIDDIEVGGQTIPAGDSIISLLGAANHDPRVFAQPHELHIDRTDNPHVAFGGGIHHCLGAALARTEAQVALVGLAQRMPHLDLLEARRRATFTLRGYESITVEPS
jgi:cytochrome P450